MMETKGNDLLDRLLASSMLVACPKCGSSATYNGSPDKINAAAKEFYELHERCWQRNQSDNLKR